MANTCIFCGSSKDLTKEDVIAKWIGRLFKKNPGVRRTVVLGERQKDQKVVGPVFAVRNRVCRVCNNGWMARLQRHAQRFMEPLIKDQETIIIYQGQALIAAWATMTAMVTEWAHDQVPHRYYTAQERREFFEQRRIPEHTLIWLAARHPLPAPPRGTAVYLSTTNLNRLATPTEDGVTHEGHTMTLAIAHLIIQLVAIRPGGSVTASDAANFARENQFSVATLELPGPNNASITWPPGQSLDQAATEAFGDRWNPAPQ